MAHSRSRRALVALIALFVLVLVAWASRNAWLGRLGTFLDTGRPPVKSDVIVVLAGGWTGERVLKAGELVQSGFAPIAILDSPKGLMYGNSECILAQSFAVRKGFPPESFTCLEMRATSTAEEAVAIAAELRRRGIKRCLVVSVRSHLRRAEKILRREMPDIELHFTGAESPLFRLEHWYEVREGRKSVFMEWIKTVTEPFGA